MNQISMFATTTRLANRKRRRGEPYFFDYRVRVVGPEHDPKFELWKRRDDEDADLLGTFETFGTAQAAADHDLGRRIPMKDWLEGDSTDWVVPAR